MKRKTKSARRILSLALALCMLVAMIPAAVATEATGEGRYHIYDFRKGYTSGLDSAKLYSGTYSYDSMATLNPDTASDPWRIYKGTAYDGITCGGTISYINSSYINMGLRINGSAEYTDVEGFISNPLPSFRFKVVESGSYMPVVTIPGSWRADTGASLTLAILKLDAAGVPVSEICKTTDVNSRAIDSMMRVELSDEFVSLEAGEYALVIGHDSKVHPGETNQYGFAYIRSLELLTENEYVEKLETTDKITALTYDFTAMHTAEATQADVNAITYADTIAKGSAPWMIYSYLPEEATNSTEFWNKDKEGFMYNKGLFTTKTGSNLNLVGKLEGRYHNVGAAIMLHVPASGKYVVELKAGNFHNNYVVYYLMKLNDNRSVATSTEYRASEEGKKFQIDTKGLKDYAFNNGEAIELEAGEYIIATNSVQVADTMFTSLKLTPETTATLSYGEFEIGDNAEPSLVVDNASGYNTAYTSDNTAVATVDPVTGVVTGIAEGTAKITVVVSGTVKATAEYTVTVKPAKSRYHIYDFRKGYVSTLNAAKLYSGTYSYDSMATLNPDVVSDPWRIYKGTAYDGITCGGSMFYIANTYVNMGIRINASAEYTDVEGFINNPLPSFRFKVVKPGSYMPVVTVPASWRTDTGASITLVILKLDANGVPVSEVCKATDINSRAIDSMMRVELSDEFVDLTAGEYALAVGYDNKVHPGETNQSGVAYVRSLELLTENEYIEKLETTDELTKLTYDFTAMHTEEATQADVNAITYADTIAKGSAPWMIYSYLPEEPTNSAEFWSKDKEGFMYNKGLYTTSTANNLNLIGKLEGKYHNVGAAIMIHVPASGKYVVELEAGNFHKNYVEFFLMKLNDDRTVATSTEYRASEEGQKLQIATNGLMKYYFNNGEAIELEAGEYIIAANGVRVPDTMFSSLTLTPEVEEVPEYDPGDINGDGRVNTRDVTNLRRYLAGGYEDSITIVEGMTDVNGDGRENTRDVAALRAIIAG